VSVKNKSLKLANLPQAEYKESTKIMLASLDLGFRQQRQILTFTFTIKNNFFRRDF
jgi:hypothetical protein